MSEQTKTAKGLDKFFGITASGSNYRTEIIAGLTTFMSMVYILFVNGDIFGGDKFGNLSGTFGAAYIATAIGAIVGTLLMAFLAKMPLAQAPGMGVNYAVAALAAFTAGLSFANALIFVLLDGLIFVFLTVTGLRQKIFEAIPVTVRKAIGVGIGMFIAFIGMQNADIVVDSSTLVGFTSFNFLNGVTYGSALPAFIALVGVIVIAVLSHHKVNGAILWGILGSAVLYYVMAAIGLIWKDAACEAVFASITLANPFDAFAEWGTNVAGKVVIEGWDFSAYLAIEGNSVGTLALLLITTALSLCMIDMFDTIGTLYGACRQGNLLDEKGTPIRMNKMLLADAIATCTGALAGTSTVTTYVESSSGVAAGGKTGMTALVTALCFIAAMFFSPIGALVPSCATATALIWVGVLMMGAVSDIDWKKPAEAIIAFLTIAVMAFGYSISKGIGIGIIAAVVVSICTGKIKEVKPATWVIAILYVAMFVLCD